MSDKMPSPSNKAVNSSRTNRRRGGALVLALLLIGLVIALVRWGPRRQDQPFNQAATVSLGINDHTSPQQLAALREQAIVRLNGYGWVDEEAGRAHIPIDRAIALVAENGLPVGTMTTDTGEQAVATSVDPASLDLQNVNYEDDVLPIFEEHCSECHGSEEPEEELELTRYRTAMIGSINGPVIVPGDPDNSYLVEQIVSGRMPKRGDPLSSTEIETIIAWIAAGAPEN